MHVLFIIKHCTCCQIPVVRVEKQNPDGTKIIHFKGRGLWCCITPPDMNYFPINHAYKSVKVLLSSGISGTSGSPLWFLQ